MEYQEFISNVREAIENRVEDTAQVKVTQVLKNNSNRFDALMIQREGRNISPTIYLNSIYNQYDMGKEDFEEIIERILQIDSSAPSSVRKLAEEKFNDFESLKPKIRMKIVNTEMNTELLKMIPHRTFLDLSIVYYLYLSENATSLIYENHISTWNITEEELFKIAQNNTGEHYEFRVIPITDILMELLEKHEVNEVWGMAKDIEQVSEERMMFVCTNNLRTFGAMALTDKKLLRDFAVKHGDFYIIPSSIHELIFVPKGRYVDPQELIVMINEVNHTQVLPEEVLSYKLYEYDLAEDDEQMEYPFIYG